MPITTLSSREFNQRASEAKRATHHGPVFITDRGRPTHVLMSFADYLSAAHPTTAQHCRFQAHGGKTSQSVGDMSVR